MNYGDCKASATSETAATTTTITSTTSGGVSPTDSDSKIEPATGRPTTEQAGQEAKEVRPSDSYYRYYGQQASNVAQGNQEGGEMFMKIRDSFSSSKSNSSSSSSSVCSAGSCSADPLASRSQAVMDGRQRVKCVGQLVLNVDFAPPKQLEATETPAVEQSYDRLEQDGHLIELSLCVKQQQSTCLRQASNPLNQEEPPSGSTCDTGDAGAPTHVEPDQAQRKRRLVYERIDKISLRLGGLAAVNNEGLPIIDRLPFKSGAFDACFCFNLLNVRASAAKNCATALGDQQEEGEQQQVDGESWLRMERLTRDIRMALLSELSRIVKYKGRYRSSRSDIPHFRLIITNIGRKRRRIFRQNIAHCLRLRVPSSAPEWGRQRKWELQRHQV